MNNIIRIEEWSIVSGQYDPPEAGARIYGRVYGRAGTNDGDWVTTSVVEYIKDDIIHVYSGKMYELGEPSAEYERLYPNSKQRVLSSLSEER